MAAGGGTAAGRWILDFLCLYAALLAVGARPPLSVALLAYSAAQLLGQIPLTPGGLGVVEAGLTGTLALAGSRLPRQPWRRLPIGWRHSGFRSRSAWWRGSGTADGTGRHDPPRRPPPRAYFSRSTSPAMSRSVRVANARAIEGCQRRSPGTAAPPGSRVDAAGRRATVLGIKPPIPDSDAPGRCRAGH